MSISNPNPVFKVSRRILLSIVLALCVGVPVMVNEVGCAGKTITVHPGAANTFDSVAYDTLMTEKAALKAIEADLVQYPQLKPTFEKLKSQYLAAASAYKVYHTIAVGGGKADQTVLDGQIQQLIKDVAGLAGQIAGGL